MASIDNADFKSIIWAHYHAEGRKLPWRYSPNPYTVLVSEIMLQQTQASRVIPKYEEFLVSFPDVESLAFARLADVLKVWSGLGYNRRAKYLHEAAKILVKKHDGKIPSQVEELEALPGIGSNTAKSILAFAYNIPNVFIETNIRSVYIHYFFRDKKDISDAELLPKIKATLDTANPREWYWALMDHGVYIKKTFGNPSQASKHYVVQSRFDGSNRQLRGEVIRQLLSSGKLTEFQIKTPKEFSRHQLAHVLNGLINDELIRRTGDTIELA